jgi:hypothetical protein
MVRQFPPETHQHQQQCPCTLKAKDTWKPPSSSNSLPHLAPPPPSKHPNRKRRSKHTKREKRHPMLPSWHHSEQPTQSKRLSPDHLTKRLAKLGSTQTPHQPALSTTGLLKRTKQASRNMRRYRCVRLREIQVSK